MWKPSPPRRLAAAGKRKWEKFLHAAQVGATANLCQASGDLRAGAASWSPGRRSPAAKSRLALARIRMLRVLQRQIEAYRAEIEKLFAQHPDHHLFGSLPGAGPKIAPRLLGEIGSDRARFDDPSALQALAGTAPVSYQSGQIHKVYLRRHCNKSLRATHPSVGQPQSTRLSLGGPLLSSPAHPRQIPRQRFALP